MGIDTHAASTSVRVALEVELGFARLRALTQNVSFSNLSCAGVEIGFARLRALTHRVCRISDNAHMPGRNEYRPIEGIDMYYE